jgi:hypothetical protein
MGLTSAAALLAAEPAPAPAGAYALIGGVVCGPGGAGTAPALVSVAYQPRADPYRERCPWLSTVKAAVKAQDDAARHVEHQRRAYEQQKEQAMRQQQQQQQQQQQLLQAQQMAMAQAQALAAAGTQPRAPFAHAQAQAMRSQIDQAAEQRFQAQIQHHHLVNASVQDGAGTPGAMLAPGSAMPAQAQRVSAQYDTALAAIVDLDQAFRYVVATKLVSLGALLGVPGEAELIALLDRVLSEGEKRAFVGIYREPEGDEEVRALRATELLSANGEVQKRLTFGTGAGAP